VALKILVTFALENEFAPWRAMHKFRESTWGKVDVFAAEIAGANVAVLLTGVGQRPAKLALSKIAWGESGMIEYCISSGLVGGLRPEYSIAQIMVAREVASEGVRDEKGESEVTLSSASLVSFASECGATVVNRFYSAERAIGRPDEKKHLGKGADAVEMESFEILAAATDAGIPAVAVRAVSDTSEEPLPLDMNEIFSDEGRLSIARVAGQVALHPQALPGLVKLGQQSKKAAESLAQFLDRYIARIAASAQPVELKAAAQ
jgi:nucleoside phosphorylase